MNKAELIEEVAELTGKTKLNVGEVLAGVLAIIKESDNVTLVGFGKFERKTRAGRTGRNPKTGEAIQIPAKEVMTFKAAKG